MATAWPTQVRADYDPDKAGRTGRVAALLTRDLVLAQLAMRINVPENTTTSATYVTLATKELFIPLWAEVLALSFVAQFDIRTTAGTATYRIVDNATSTNSTEMTTTSASYGHGSSVALVIGSGWGGTVRSILFQGKTTAGTCYARSEDLSLSRFSD